MILFFDLFNTIYDISAVPKEHLREYRRLIDQFLETGKHEELDMTEWWELIKPFPEVIEVLGKLNDDHDLITLSNCPCYWQEMINEKCGLYIMETTGLERYSVYKPHIGAYYAALGEVFEAPRDCMMVTANRTFGDLENAAKVGMHSFHVDRENGGTLWGLVEHLENLQ